MHERVAITGSEGNIGTVLKEGLTEFDIKEIDLPDVDVRDIDQLIEALEGCDVVIHLAWNSKTENFKNGKIDPDNILMAINVYRASQQAGLKRVIMASSIHADDYYNWQGPGLLTVDHSPVPDSPYGEDKIEIEKEGRKFAGEDLEVVCIRFGGINLQDSPSPGSRPQDTASYLSHEDCINLIRSILNAEKIPDNFVVMYAVSDNERRIHDILNPFGWIPKPQN